MKKAILLVLILIFSTLLIGLPSVNAAPVDLKFDFGTAGSPLESGYTRVTESTLYSAGLGYGWASISGLNSRDRGAPNNLQRDFVFYSSNRGFNVDLADGTYDVTVIIGDNRYSHDNIDVYAEGALKANDVSVSAGIFVTRVFSVTVTGSQLNLVFVDDGGSDANWVVNAIEIEGDDTPPGPIATTATLIASPNPVAVGSPVLFSADITPDPPTSHLYMGCTFTVTRPTGATEVLGPFTSDPTGTVTMYYTPTMIGTYFLSFDLPEQTFGDAIYLGFRIDDIPFLSTEEPPPSDSYKFDFGTSTSPVASGYTRVTESTLYYAGLGYGWTSTSNLDSRDRGAPTNLRRDFVFSSSDREFKVNLADGTYTVKVTMGDNSYQHEYIDIYAENIWRTSSGLIYAGTFNEREFSVDVSDGQLNLVFQDILGPDENWVVNAIEITEGTTPPEPEFILSFDDFPAYPYNVDAYKVDNRFVGCGPTTGAMILAYFEHLNSLTGLLETPVAGVNEGLDTAWTLHHDYMGTLASGFGSVLSIKPGLEDYASDRGQEIQVMAHAPTWHTPASSWYNDYGAYGDAWTNDGTFWVNLGVDNTGINPDLFCDFLSVRFSEGIPIMLTVDSDGDGHGDHWVPCVGFDRAAEEYYYYNTWTTTLQSNDIASIDDPGAGTFAISFVRSIEYIGPISPPPSVPTKFDFGTASSPVESGYTRITHTTLYSAALGYGWTSTSSLDSRDRSAPTNLRRDFVFYSSDRGFNVDLADGTYTVKVTIGDNSYGHDYIDVYAEGVLKANDVSVSAGSFSEPTFSVVVSGGQLNLVFVDDGGSDANWVVNAVEITGGTIPPPTFWRGYDFGTPSSPLETSYIRITHTNARDRGGTDYLRRDFIYDSVDATFIPWDIPNGDYLVTVIIGDQNYRHDMIDVSAEGVLKINDLTVNAGEFAVTTFAVTLSDGELNIRFHDDGGTDANWVVNAITIESVT